MRSLGADHVIDYTRQDFADGTNSYDLILDIGGNSPLSRLRRALTDSGTLVIVGGEEGGKWTGGFGRSLRAPLLSPFVGQRLIMLASKERASDQERLIPLLEARHGNAEHRPHLPAGTRHGGDAAPRSRRIPGQGRHHYLSLGWALGLRT